MKAPSITAAPAPAPQAATAESFIVSPALGEELPSLIWQDITPQRAKQILSSAVQGDIQSQHELFGLMIDTWPRLSKALAEVNSVVRRLSWNVDPFVEDDEQDPSPEAEQHAELVRRALRSWRPEVGSVELTFEDTLDQILDARARGVSVCELVWQPTKDGVMPRAAQWISPVHYGWAPNGRQLGLLETGGWRPFVQDKFLVGIWRARAGAPVATALLRPLVPYWVGRTFGWQWLLRTAQVFGVPFRWANYDASQPEVGAKVAAMLKNLGAAGWAAFPSGTSLEFKEAMSNARDNPQVLLQEMGDQACDLLVLGQTLSSTSQATGLGSGNASLHGSVRQEILHAAAWWVADVLNYQLVPAVIRLNFGDLPAALPRVAPDLSLPTDPKALAERDAILAEKLGMKLGAKWAHERHGVPLPQEGEELLDGPVPPPAFGAPGGLGLPGGKEKGPQESAKKGEDAGGERIEKEAGGSGRDEERPVSASKSTQDQFAGFRGASQQGDLKQPDRPGRPTARFFEELTGMEARFLAPVQPYLEHLLEIAEKGDVSQEEFAQALERSKRALPELFETIDESELATALRQTMAAEMVNGAAAAPRA